MLFSILSDGKMLFIPSWTSLCELDLLDLASWAIPWLGI